LVDSHFTSRYTTFYMNWLAAIILALVCVIGVSIIIATIDDTAWEIIASCLWIILCVFAYFRFFDKQD
jgi:L-asparagine transporter-like permease